MAGEWISLGLIFGAGIGGYYLGTLGMVPQADLDAALKAKAAADAKLAAANSITTPAGQNNGYWTNGPSMYGTGSTGPRPDFSMGWQNAGKQFASIGGQNWR